MDPLPTVVGPNGLIPLDPTTIQNNLLAQVDVTVPGMITRLPGLLAENISSVDVLAILQCENARVEALNDVTPKGANAWLLLQLGGIYGVQSGEASNTSAYVVFTAPGASGFVVPPGFVVTDGVYQYVVQDGGAIGAGGQSAPLFCIATLPGTWAVPAGTITQIVTSVPINIPLSCSNPYPGTPSIAAEDETSFRARTLTAGLASAQGMPSFAKTAIWNVPGVDPRLVSIQQQSTGGWKVIVGGNADPFAVAYAIYQGIADISSLVPSETIVENITNSTDAVVTTAINHGLSDGQTAFVTGITAGMIGINNQPLTVTVIDEKTFSTGFNSQLSGIYTVGGIVTPNFRNNIVAINDYPDVYTIPFVSPPLQTVTISALWNTIETNFINQSAVSQLTAPALAAYVNSVQVGQPLNEMVMRRAFQDAVQPILPAPLLTRLVFSVSINGVGTAPLSGTAEYVGDPESYFYADPTGSGITVSQG